MGHPSAVDRDGRAVEVCGFPAADGTALNADLESYIVVPPAIIAGTKGIVLGCAATTGGGLSCGPRRS